ncbi:TRAP transporter substrate-binding protein DctP [Pusillimonas sp. CC-YST705]|uniref:TRAP transporter substrate-binding protein DctP n=1 Tax=Mesopusillimonas faecipullorum TaxID=2755040 RepID=A0ABS8CCQ2_9BURK|nr:TRAP transporter substrate-binding protein DctP [Mesopusillimonas faecipullorum]MCB5363810.1 TRAP transporter substrate-binding protein DctP [Mesopusillimonas faecipullorum]
MTVIAFAPSRLQCSLKLAAGLALAVLACATSLKTASAEEVTLRAVSSFDMNTFFSRHFEQFVEKVNKEGKGLVQINYLGGPQNIPPFEVGNAVSNGVVDMANISGAFYTSLVPEALAMSFTNMSAEELRANGATDYINTILAPKNLVYQARLSDHLPYHLYTNKGFTGDLTGQKIRITPIYRDFFMALGATVVQTSPGEVYTALERGVVDGYGWPIAGILDLGWQEKTKYRVDPGFYNSEHGILMNLKKWNSLTPEQREFLNKQFAWAEAQNATYIQETAEEAAGQAQAGIQTIKLEGEAATKFTQAANEAAWKRIKEMSPQHGDKLRELFSKP